MKLKIGFIGFGKFAQLRHEILQENNRVELVGYHEPQPNPEINLSYFSDIDELFQNVDAVLISVPPKFAPSYVKNALTKKKHVFCEKPAAKCLQDFLIINEEIIFDQNLVIAYGFNHRLHDSVLKTKEIINKKLLGKILWMRGRYGKEVGSNYYQDWRCNVDLNGGGILIDQGIHMIDIMNFLANGFTGAQSVLSNNFLKLTGVEDNAFVTLFSSESGITASVHSTITQWRYLFSLEVFLEHGSIIINGLRTRSGNYGKEILSIHPRETCISNILREDIEYTQNNSWFKEMTEFVDACISNRPYKYASYNDAKDITILIDKIYKGALWI